VTKTVNQHGIKVTLICLEAAICLPCNSLWANILS